MENYIQADDYELWLIIKGGALVPTKANERGETVPKTPEEFNAEDFKKMEKNAKAKKLLYFGLGPDEYSRICECETAKQIWDALEIAHEGTSQVKQSRIELLMRKYELFEMGDKESIMEMYTRFTHITNELKSLGKAFTTEELVRKILRFLPQTWEAKVTAIQEAKDMKSISLDELIGNLQTYELRRSSQQKEENKRDRGLALKALEEDSSDMDEEDMALITRKFKKFFRKSKELSKKKNPVKTKNSDKEQVPGCFKCGKRDHFVKNCPLLKEEQPQEQFRHQGRKQFPNKAAKRFSRAMLAAWGETTEEDENSDEEEAELALMARSDSESEDEPMDSLAELKGKVRGLSKFKLEELLTTLMDEYDALNTENVMLKDTCSELKRDISVVEFANDILKKEKVELEEQTAIVFHDLDVVNNKMKDLEGECLQLKQKIENLTIENAQLLEKLNKTESDLARNKQWNSSSTALKWLNTHHNRNKNGLGFMAKHTDYPVNRKYVSLPEYIVCYHCGKTGHYRYTCPSRKNAMERSMIYVKQIWVKKNEIYSSKRMGPKWIWVPKTNP